MDRKEFIKFLVDHDIPFETSARFGTDAVWVFSKKELNEKMALPEGMRDGYFVSYLRVSQWHTRDFDGESEWYTRYNGVCGPKSVEWVMNRVKELGRE